MVTGGLVNDGDQWNNAKPVISITGEGLFANLNISSQDGPTISLGKNTTPAYAGISLGGVSIPFENVYTKK